MTGKKDDDWEELEAPAARPRKFVRQIGRQWPCQLCLKPTEGTPNVVCEGCKSGYRKMQQLQLQMIREFPELGGYTIAELFERMWTKLRSQYNTKPRR